MKKNVLTRLLATILVILCFALLAGCGDTTPKAKENLQTEFTLDVRKQDTKEIKPADFIDENGAEGITYSVSVSDPELAAVAESNGIFTVTPLKKGEATLTLSVKQGEKVVLTLEMKCHVTDSAPGTPHLEKEVYSYDKAAGGNFELPVDLNGGLPSVLSINGSRIQDTYWRYNETTKCIELDETYVFSLEAGNYEMVLTTTGGSAEFTLNLMNSMKTAFDETTEKTASLGKAESVKFLVDFNGTTVEKITYGDYELQTGDYTVTDDGIEINAEFFRRTYRGNTLNYCLYLSNNDTYLFSIDVGNQLFFTDYDVTTIHNDLQSVTGQNPLYQDSTRVQIVPAPEGSGLSGNVLKFTPYTEDAPLDPHGIYTFQTANGGATWYKLAYSSGKTYIVSFDYMTEGTTAGEDFRFRSWDNSISAPSLETGKPGEVQHFTYTFTWTDSALGTFVYGKFLNGGSIYIDNFSVIEIGDMPTVAIPEYTGEDSLTVTAALDGYLVKEVLVDGIKVSCNIQADSIVLDGEDLIGLDYGTHTLTVVTSLFRLENTFQYKNTTLKSALTETEKSFTVGADSLKLAGEFSDGITVSSLTRKGGNPLDSSYTDAKSMSVGYVEVVNDGLVIQKALLDQVYGTCTYEIVYSSGARDTFTLTSNSLYYCNFDETDTWSSTLICEDPGVAEIVTGVDGMTGNVLKIETKNWTVHEPSTWFTRVFCFATPSVEAGGWQVWDCSTDKYYEISFDMKVLMNGATHSNFGYYYTTGPNGEKAIPVDYTDGEVKHVSIKIKGSDLAYFAIGLDPREGDLTSVLYLDNFGIKEIAETV